MSIKKQWTIILIAVSLVAIISYTLIALGAFDSIFIDTKKIENYKDGNSRNWNFDVANEISYDYEDLSDFYSSFYFTEKAIDNLLIAIEYEREANKPSQLRLGELQLKLYTLSENINDCKEAYSLLEKDAESGGVKSSAILTSAYERGGDCIDRDSSKMEYWKKVFENNNRQ